VEKAISAKLVSEVGATLPHVDMVRKLRNIRKNMKPPNLIVLPVHQSLNIAITKSKA
jgi:hypothetical protein